MKSINEPIKQKLCADFWCYRNEIAFVIEAIYKHKFIFDYRNCFPNFNFNSPKGVNKIWEWGDFPRPTGHNPYLNESIMDLISKLENILKVLNQYYSSVVFDNKIDMIQIDENERDFFQNVFCQKYPFRLSYDDFFMSFMEWNKFIVKFLHNNNQL